MSIKYDKNNLPYIELECGYKIRLEYEEIEDEKYKEKAEKELRETPEIKEKAVRDFKEIIKNEKDFVFPMNDTFLIPYLRPCKFYPESAFERMQKYFKFKVRHKKICENLTPDAVSSVFDEGLLKYFPLRDKEGRRVVLVHFGKKWKPSRVSINDIFRAVQFSLQVVMFEPMSQINGVSVLIDFEGLSLNQIVHFTPMFASMLLEWLQEAVPLRIKGIYFVNNSNIFNLVFKVFKPFIGAKLRNRIHFVGTNFETLDDALGKECLPKCYGGNFAIDEYDGKLITDMMQQFSYQFEIMEYAGYNSVDKDILKKMDEAVKHWTSMKTNNN